MIIQCEEGPIHPRDVHHATVLNYWRGGIGDEWHKVVVFPNPYPSEAMVVARFDNESDAKHSLSQLQMVD